MDTDSCPCACEITKPVQSSCCCSGDTTKEEKTEIFTTTGTLNRSDTYDHVLARLSFNRMGHRVRPGLYRLGNPDSESPVFVSANYTLSFDALRSSLQGIDAYILVIDTRGINVWCAAGKGTFGTDEIVNRIRITGLEAVVSHRKIIIPQLGAPGVSAHEVAKRSGFRVEYGPVRASDLPQYLKEHRATEEMREVTFTLKERLVLIPVELIHILHYTLLAVIVFGFAISWSFAVRILIAVLAGTALFPVLLPYLPTKDFSTKGFILGWLLFIPLATLTFITEAASLPVRGGMALSELLIFPAIIAYLALNFTGSTPFTSRSGVKREIYRYIRPMAGMFFGGIILATIIWIFSKVVAP